MKAKPKTVRISFQGDTALSLATVKLKMLVILAKRQPDDLPFSAKRLRVERVEKPRGKRLGRGEIERLREDLDGTLGFIGFRASAKVWQQRTEAAEAEVERLKSCSSTVEIMCENPSVDSHVREWEARCLKAEAEVERLRTERAIIDSKLKDTAIGWAQGPILAALQQARDLGREEAQAEVEQLRKALEGMVNCPVGGSGQRLPTPETVARARAALRGEGEK